MRETNGIRDRDVNTVTQRLTNVKYHKNQRAHRESFAWVLLHDKLARNFTRKHFLGAYVRKHYPSGVRTKYYTASSAGNSARCIILPYRTPSIQAKIESLQGNTPKSEMMVLNRVYF